MTSFQIQRIYDNTPSSAGYRVLVDRLWPRGVSKEKARLDQWAKAIAPSPELRTWFNHDPARFAEFHARYEDELAANPAVNEFLQSVQDQATVTLLYGAKDPRVNHAVVLQQFLTHATE